MSGSLGILRHAILSLFFLILFALGYPVLAEAQQDNGLEALWHVGPIASQANDDDLVAAKQKSISDARSRAFSIMLQRIVSATDQANLVLPKDDTLASFELSRQISNEKFGGDLYSATFNFDFLPDSIIAYLRQLGITPVVKHPDSLLVVAAGVNLPVGRFRDTLWEETFEHQDLALFVGNPIVQTVDLEPEFLARLRVGEPTIFNHLQDAYAVDAVLIISLDLASNPYRLRLQHNRDGEVATIAFSLSPDEVDLSFEGLLNLRARIEKFWRQSWFQRTLDQPERQDIVIPIEASFSSIKRFISLRDTLADIPAMQQVRILEVSRDTALVKLAYNGSMAELDRTLADRNLRLTKNQDDDIWQLIYP